MESSEEKKECVKVSVNIRPLITTELLMGCTDCVTVVPGEPQVQIGSHAFTYDHVYGSSGTPASSVFEECVRPLVDALFHGYNATVLAYGQTGSGKTYTMGTNYNGEGNTGGIIPQVMETIFKRVEALKETAEFLIRVSFIEIFKEEVYDLLDPQPVRAEGVPAAKSAAISRTPIQIRETVNGGITLAGVTEAEVRSTDEMASYLARGSLSRATGSTNMNSQSSRSHAIFTICMEQKKMTNSSVDGSVNTEVGDDILVAKLHLVDLAGSERAKRTGADGLRLKEGIHINRGLLALGNVISALGDEKKRKEGGHVPYRDSKLTRLLQDSLGGNSKTVMIACISPADSNAEETINTLKYANRARNIQNKAVVNRDPVAAEMQRMRSQLEQLQAELLFCRGGNASLEELQILHQKNSLLEARNAVLLQQLKERQSSCERLKKSALDAQVEKDNLILKLESARGGKPWDEIDKLDKDQDVDIMRGYISKIQELEAELLRAQHFSSSSRNNFTDHLSVEDMDPSIEDNNLDISSEAEQDEKEKEHSSVRNQLNKELQDLDKCLEQKEAEMKSLAKSDTSVLKQHYEKKLQELEQEKKLLLKEIEDLRSKYLNVSSTSGESAEKLKADYLQKLNMLESHVSELKKKQEAQAQLLKQKQKSDEAAKHLQEEIQRIKSQKVQLQQKIKQESEQFRAWKASREKEVMQLKKEGRRNEYEMHKLMALNQRQKMVLQRKSEEAAMATKRLKELLEAKRSREVAGSGNATSAGIQALIQAVEHELEVALRVHEVRSEYERQTRERQAMAKELARLKEESDMLKQKTIMECPQTMSPGARSSRISALDNMLKASSSTLVAMASQLSEAEERGRVLNGRGRWSQVRSLVEAKNIMNYLFDIASSSRCQVRDKELNCREKDTVISELKEKVVGLNILVRQLETQRRELQNEKLKSLPVRNSLRGSNRTSLHFGNTISKAPDNSQSLNQSVKNLEDMDISDNEISDMSDSDDNERSDDEDWIESGKKGINRRSKIGLARRLTTGTRRRETLITDGSSKEVKPEEEKVPDHCCTCSNKSYCKTKRCECVAAGGTCSASCQCSASRCTNRENGAMDRNCEEFNTGAIGSGGSHSSGDGGNDEVSELVSQGTLLLQSSLSEKIDQENSDEQPRKALSNIDNTLVDPKASKADRRKKWRKSTIQLVPTAPLPPAIPENKESSRNIEDIPLKLPPALDSIPCANNPPLSDRNSLRQDESANSKEVRGVIPQRSPVKIRKISDNKENMR